MLSRGLPRGPGQAPTRRRGGGAPGGPDRGVGRGSPVCRSCGAYLAGAPGLALGKAQVVRGHRAPAPPAGMPRPPPPPGLPGAAPDPRPGPPPRGSSCSPSRVTPSPTSRARPVCLRTKANTHIFLSPAAPASQPPRLPPRGTPHRTHASLRTAFSLHTHFVSCLECHSCIRGCQYSLESFIESQKAIRGAL